MITAEEAWKRAAQIIARIKVGEEPVPGSMTAMLAEGPTVGKMAERYPDEHVAVRCKPKTESNNRSVVTKHIVPKLDQRLAPAVGAREVTELHHWLCAIPRIACTVIKLLSRVCNLAEERRQITEMIDPRRLVVTNRVRMHERFLSEVEFRWLVGCRMRRRPARGDSVNVVAAIRLLPLAGCRTSEFLNLRWN